MIKQVTKAIPMQSNTTDRQVFRVIGTTDIDGQGTQHDIESVDPFIFLDEARINYSGTTVEPHPHTGLAAISYIFSGEIKVWDNMHGEGEETNQAGGLYLINSGQGIVHSEVSIVPTHWVQLWINPGVYDLPLPKAYSQLASPSDIPICREDNLVVRVLIGEAYGCRSPIESPWPILYLHVTISPHAAKTIDLAQQHWAGFIYVINGQGKFGHDEIALSEQTIAQFDTAVSLSLPVINTSDSELSFMVGLGKPHGKGFVKLLGNGGAMVAKNEDVARKAMAVFEADQENFGKVS